MLFRSTGTGLAPATSAPGLGSPLPHLHRNWARPCHICTGTGLTPATSGPGLGSPLPHLHRDWARPCHICTGTGPDPPTSASGLDPSVPHLRRDWTHPCHICTGTGPAPATSAPGPGPPFSHRDRDRAHICTGTWADPVAYVPTCPCLWYWSPGSSLQRPVARHVAHAWLMLHATLQRGDMVALGASNAMLPISRLACCIDARACVCEIVVRSKPCTPRCRLRLHEGRHVCVWRDDARDDLKQAAAAVGRSALGRMAPTTGARQQESGAGRRPGTNYYGYPGVLNFRTVRLASIGLV